MNFKEQREFERIEAAIMAAETRVQELETTLNDPEFHCDTLAGSSGPYGGTANGENGSGAAVRTND